LERSFCFLLVDPDAALEVTGILPDAALCLVNAALVLVATGGASAAGSKPSLALVA
jgi:hypothetical protein